MHSLSSYPRTDGNPPPSRSVGGETGASAVWSRICCSKCTRSADGSIPSSAASNRRSRDSARSRLRLPTRPIQSQHQQPDTDPPVTGGESTRASSSPTRSPARPTARSASSRYSNARRRKLLQPHYLRRQQRRHHPPNRRTPDPATTPGLPATTPPPLLGRSRAAAAPHPPETRTPAHPTAPGGARST